ncbi:toll-like receptor 13 [Gigantopelta aegis]|uniref:toll-like receptor 13 n=1 Tax=Gigantopelta aegis TaxID=1735272 RepID=UPI001B88A034|nr:toll-like receptor 13 [Gigantopelta aegis]
MATVLDTTFLYINLSFSIFCQVTCVGNFSVMKKPLCWINGTVAVCSGHGNLSYIPAVPSNITRLSFNFNNLPQVSTYTFTNVTHLKLKELHIVGDHIKMITATAFQVLQHLEYLDISHNNISPKFIARAFIGLGKTPIQRLDMVAMNISFIPPHFFDSLKLSKITTVHLHQNQMSYFNCSDFLELKFLKHLGLAQNLISKLLFTSSCTLPELDMSYNCVKYVCMDGVLSDSLIVLDVKYNGIYRVDSSTFKCFPKLQVLYLDGNYISRLHKNSFASLSNLSMLSMNANINLKAIEVGAFNNSNLRKLLLENSGEHFKHYNWDMFKGCHLVSLDISKNNLNGIPPDILKRLFQPLVHSLRFLVISDASLTTIPSFVSTLTKLNHLILNNNIISGWSTDSLSTFTNLEHLDLSQNSISVVVEGSLPDNILSSLEAVDLSENPLDCSCANVWFIKVFQAHLKIFDHSRKPCRCSSPASKHNVVFKDVHMSENSCLLNFTSQMIVVASSSILLTILIVVIISYRYRWHLRYLLYMFNNRRREEDPQVNEDQFLYDIFVVYSSEDSDWVLDRLVPKLEEDLGFRVCVHERNFVPGKLIVDNIMASIDSSKRIMVVLSNSFSQRDWCQFELNVVQRHVLEKGQDLLVVVVLEQLNNRHLTPTMFTMLQTTTYITWPDDVDSEQGFWDNLTLALRGG